MDDLMESFLGDMWAMMKYAEKGCGVCGASRQSLKLFIVPVRSSGGDVTDDISADPHLWAVQVDGRAMGSHPMETKMLGWTAGQEDL